MNNAKILETNEFLRRTRNAARNLQQEEQLLIKRYGEKNQHITRYADYLLPRLPAKLGLALTVPAHIAAVVWEGIMIQPLCKEWFRGVLVADGASNEIYWLNMASVLPIIMLYGLSLATGHQWYRAAVGRHDLVPSRLYIPRPGALITTLLLAIGYLLLLNLLMQLANNTPGANASTNNLIFYLGVVELVLGIFALEGWGVIWAKVKLGLHIFLCRRSESRLRNLERQKEENYQYYRQSLVMLSDKERELFSCLSDSII